MSERKRKHDAVTAEKVAAERKVIIPTKDSRASAVVANTRWNDAMVCLSSAGGKMSNSSHRNLPPGIFGKIGNYIGLINNDDGHTKTDNTLFSLCMAVGPDIASYIRKAYLENSLSYLEYLEETLVRDGGRCLSEEECALAGENLLQWMQYNPWWRDACRSPTTFNQKEQGGKVPTICKQISIKSFGSVENGEQFLDSLIQSASGHIAIPLELCKHARIEKPLDEKYNVVMSVNGNSYSVSNMSEFDDEILAPDREKEIYVMHRSFELLFFNPVLSINLGLLDLLRFLLEELKLNVNFQEWRGPRLGDVEVPLIFHSMIQPDEKIFEYLLSFDDINLNPIIDRCPITNEAAPSNITVLHYLNQIVGLVLMGKFDVSRLKTLLSQDGVDINYGPLFPDGTLGENVPERISPLYALFCSAIKFDSDFDIVEAFVNAGASVEFTLSVASSPGFHQGLQLGVEMTLRSYRDNPRFAALTEHITVEDMRSIHHRLVGFLRKLKGRQYEQNSQ